MAMMKIHRITVTDDKGVDHTWEGIEGYVRYETGSIHSKGKAYQQTVEAQLTLEPDPTIRPQPGEL